MNASTRGLRVAASWGLLFFAGCVAVDIPFGKRGEGVQFAAKARVGLDTAFYKADLGPTISTTPVHPADAGFLVGQTSTEPDDLRLRDFDDRGNWAPTAGLFASFGTDAVRLVGGLSGRYNTLYHQDGYRDGIYSVRQQISDVRPKRDGSFVFTQVKPTWYTVAPSVGLEFGDQPFMMGVSMSFPYMGWQARSGHDRSGHWQTMQRDSWKGFGTRYDVTAAFRPNESLSLAVDGYYEQYRARFIGERAKVSGVGAFLLLSYSF